MKTKGKVPANSAQFIFIFLGLLTAFGPFVTDMYLPSLSAMAAGVTVVWFEILLFGLCVMMGAFAVATTPAMDAACRQAGTASALWGLPVLGVVEKIISLSEAANDE